MIKYRKIFIISILFFLGSFLFYLWSFSKIKKLDITKVINYSNINFAGENVSFEDKYYFNKEKFEKELSITRYNLYQFVLYHKREPIYLPIIEKKLKEAWIPDDFKYLAIAESSLKNDALSDSNAWWIWQFIPETGKRYWLIINENIDERYNFEKETDAAILFFKKLYEDFNNRTLVAAAYNRGENWLRRALDDQNVNSYYDLYINEETWRYVFRILAIKYLMQNRYEIFNKEDLWEQFTPPKTKEIEIRDIASFKKYAQDNWYNYASLKQLNPWIIWDVIPAGVWKIKVFDY